MRQQLNKQPLSITYFILNSKNFVMVLISNNKYIFVCYLRVIWESATRLSMNYICAVSFCTKQYGCVQS